MATALKLIDISNSVVICCILENMNMYNTQLENMMQPKNDMIRKILQLILFTSSMCIMAAGSVMADEDDLVQLQFDKAMDERESGKVYDAIKIFENILATNPYLNRARLELAVAYHEASYYEKAMEQFQIVLDDPETPESVRLAILAYIGQLYSDELISLADIAMEQNNYKKALLQYEKVTKLPSSDDNKVKAHAGMAQCLKMLQLKEM